MKTWQPNSGPMSFAILVTVQVLSCASLERSLAESSNPSPIGPSSIPMDQIGAVAGRQYSGNGLSVAVTESGALLRCAFQRLEGEVTKEGLWLTSTVTDRAKDRFCVNAVAVGRTVLPDYGEVTTEGQMVRFSRPGLVEEYSVSIDGVRQDFVVLEKPGGASVPASRLVSSLAPPTDGELRLELSVTGARVEQTAHGAQLLLEKSGRRIAYLRLKVTDAKGKELPAHIEVASHSALHTSPLVSAMAVVVDDENAIYPVRIDPTFSDANWISLGGLPGADSYLSAAVVDTSGNLFIGGFFTVVGDVIANRIAKWDGNSWSVLGAGMDGTVRVLAVSGSDVYAGGEFRTATNGGGMAVTVNRIAKWDGSSWSALGEGMDGTVGALAVWGSTVYAGGFFTTAGGNTASRIAKWDGNNWNALGSGVNNTVYAFAVSGSNIYAGGAFTTATNSGGLAVTVNCIAKWDGSSWSALGSGMNNTVRALAVSGSNVYVGGFFTSATNSGDIAVTVNRIAKWDGHNWNTLGVGFNDWVLALAVSGSNIYGGGTFTRATNSGGIAVTVNRIAKWDGSSWSALGSGMSSFVQALAVTGGDVYAGGDFSTAGGITASHIARWNGNSWSAVGSGMDESVWGLAVMGSDLYAGGWFSKAGDSEAKRIAKWNGSSWSALGSGVNNNTVWALEVLGPELYAGGDFTTAGGITASRIAKWDGNSWSAIGSGLNNTVYALEVSGSNVYAGGDFTTAGGNPASRIAKWDGNSWSVLGLGVNNRVNALVVSGSNVYVGGAFTTATNSGGMAVEVNRIAKWDGNSWLALGSGVNNTVYALAVSGSNIYAGGTFTTATNSGGVALTVNSIAKWDGNSWSALGSGVGSGIVRALVVSGSDIFAGGGFGTAGGNAASAIAKWDGSSWSAMGSGMNKYVYALALSGSDLYAGGDFEICGGKVSAHVARARLADLPPFIITTNGSVGFSNSMFGFVVSGSADQALIIDGSTNMGDWLPLQTNTLGTGLFYFSDPNSSNFTHRFYRLRGL